MVLAPLQRLLGPQKGFLGMPLDKSTPMVLADQADLSGTSIAAGSAGVSWHGLLHSHLELSNSAGVAGLWLCGFTLSIPPVRNYPSSLAMGLCVRMRTYVYVVKYSFPFSASLEVAVGSGLILIGQLHHGKGCNSSFPGATALIQLAFLPQLLSSPEISIRRWSQLNCPVSSASQ